MTDQITPQQFYESDGVDDWRVMPERAAVACFRTGDFASGLALVNDIGRLAGEMDHHPDLELKYAEVFVTLTSHDVKGLSRRDAEMARRISALALERDILADPNAVEKVDLTIDVLSIPEVRPFWAALLAYDEVGDRDLVSPHGRGTSIWFQKKESLREERTSMHLDVTVPDDQAEARVGAAMAEGGRVVTDQHAPAWWMLADPAGNEVRVSTRKARA